ncbi:hypothetical protein PsYK624_151260 [Phanerochaete sordida]|uniref:Deoxyribonuclease NucA/NucB domain-containing protein n=1 Tax=Phanerochaete sordida TaxID=48140 RepID=A0A9P3LLN6_9APHY|nr:hypothetical protein PsYK624_151260 [Phanerochaete sordida]
MLSKLACILGVAAAAATVVVALPSSPTHVGRDAADDCSVDPTGYKRDQLELDDPIGEFAQLNSSLAASWDNGTHVAERAELVNWNYNIDCKIFPNICENWCFYRYCKAGSFQVHVDRNANNRGRSACKSPNKCSYNCKGTGGWSLNPNQMWECDEQPKNTNTEGGPGAATRCMTKRENGDEGIAWRNFINQSGTKNPALPNGQLITVVLGNVNAGGLCASYAGGNTKCPAPITPQSPNVGVLNAAGHGSDDGIRQA